MKGLFKKLRENKKGFTLAELLVVVAIVGVLVAISIPIFSSQLEKAREATDVANMRAAKAEAVADYLSAELDTEVWTINTTDGTAVAYYNAGTGLMQKSAPTSKYGKGTTADGGATYNGYQSSESYTSKAIKVTINTKSGSVTLDWD